MEEVVGDFQLEDVVEEVLVVALEVEVLLTLVAVKVSPLVWLEEVDIVVLVVAMAVVALGVVVLGVVGLVVVDLEVVSELVVWVVALAVEVVLVEVILGVALGPSAPLVAYSKSPSTRAFCNPSMWRLTLRSKK